MNRGIDEEKAIEFNNPHYVQWGAGDDDEEEEIS